MSSFALVTEGVTDQVVIDRILSQVWPSLTGREPFITNVQPVTDETDGGGAPGGWETMLEFCREGISDALSANDFVVIQVDTDAGDHENFGVPLTDCGKDRGYEELIADAHHMIRDAIGLPIIATDGHRILIAICVHSIESWLHVELVGSEHQKNSFDRLRYQLNKLGRGGLEKTVRRYRAIARDLKRKGILAHHEDASSYGVFLRRLTQAAVCGSCHAMTHE